MKFEDWYESFLEEDKAGISDRGLLFIAFIAGQENSNQTHLSGRQAEAVVSPEQITELINILLDSYTFLNAPDHKEDHEHRLFGYLERDKFKKLQKTLH